LSTFIGNVFLALALAAGAQHAHAQAGQGDACGNPFVNHFGPWDYRTASKENLKIVESYHFTPSVEGLIKGATSMNIAADIAYTLGVFPNHVRALIAMVKLGERLKTDQPPGAHFTIECYLERAVRFRPDDTVVRILYAQYLGKHGQKDAARRELAVAADNAKDDPFAHYNIGLMYFQLGDYEAAVKQAHEAQALGNPKTGLRDLLVGVNKWRER
jgi:tetratricopeptide (TPR) repeat protein